MNETVSHFQTQFELSRLTFVALPLLLPLLSLPLNDGGGLSSLDLRFSARRAVAQFKRVNCCISFDKSLNLPLAGRKLSDGHVDNALLLFVELIPALVAVVVVVVLVVFVVALVDVRAARPFALAFRSLL